LQIEWSNKIKTGYFKDNKANGFGILSKQKEELIYQGEFLNDKKNGIGFNYLDDAVSYIGEFKSNEQNGLGSMIYSESTFYLGEWKNGVHNGFVIFIQFKITFLYVIFLRSNSSNNNKYSSFYKSFSIFKYLIQLNKLN